MPDELTIEAQQEAAARLKSNVALLRGIAQSKADWAALHIKAVRTVLESDLDAIDMITTIDAIVDSWTLIKSSDQTLASILTGGLARSSDDVEEDEDDWITV